ncbi:MAG: BatA domain-containing protein, partial [Bacteroidales bacterium]|nr:BatA domain-containing protein [Bacteroidales bacterium]
MTFTNPYLLFGFFAILVPILIHLFNFRRYKTVYFSNVRMLDEIQKKTRRKSQLQQLVVLALRILGIAALVFAAAQPFLKNDNVRKSGGNLISVFVDNSFSMDANSDNTSSLYEAIDAAKTIVGDFNYDDDFVLTTQDFSGEESHILNKDQIIEALDQIGISPNSRSFSEIRAFESNTAQRSTKANVVKFYISDFQKNNFDLSLLRGDSSLLIGLVPSKSVER